MTQAAIAATYRRATADDLETALQLMQEFYAIEHIEFRESFTRSVLTEFLSADQFGEFWLIEVNGAIAGYAIFTIGYSLEYGGRNFLVDELYLRETFRGQGLGSQTLNTLESHCQSLGLSVMYLVVDHNNPKARSVYERFGFKQPSRDILVKQLIQNSD
jgi:ribosomal protein S18 acetylase RimI-like enzyme